MPGFKDNRRNEVDKGKIRFLQLFRFDLDNLGFY
jgi:hypothetical protein